MQAPGGSMLYPHAAIVQRLCGATGLDAAPQGPDGGGQAPVAALVRAVMEGAPRMAFADKRALIEALYASMSPPEREAVAASLCAPPPATSPALGGDEYMEFDAASNVRELLAGLL